MNRKAMVEVKEADKNRPDNEKVAPVTHVFNSFFYKKLSSGKQTKEDKEKDIL
jgi:Ulp1 family protease